MLQHWLGAGRLTGVSADERQPCAGEAVCCAGSVLPDSTVVDLPALASQQHIDTPESIANTHCGDIMDTLEQSPVVPRLGPIVPASPALTHHRASPAFADSITIQQMAYELSALWGAQSFFASTSCHIALSRLRSATNCLSLWFSSSSCRSLLSSPTPRPLYFLRQA